MSYNRITISIFIKKIAITKSILQLINSMKSYSFGTIFKLKFIKIAFSWGRRQADNMWGTGFAFDFKHFYLDIGARGRSGFSLANAKGVSYGTSLCFGF